MADIFLSYAREDHARAKIVADALNAHGWTVWWDKKIPPGLSFREVIERELSACRCAVVLWSESSVSSEWVQEEASEAGSRRILVPVLIDHAKIPMGFRNLQAADLTAWSGAPDYGEWQQVIQRIRELAPTPAPLPAFGKSTDVPPSSVDVLPAAPESERESSPVAQPWAPVPIELTPTADVASEPLRGSIREASDSVMGFTSLGASLVLTVVFVANLVETRLEAIWPPTGSERGFAMASAFHRLEGFFAFENHDATGALALYGYSIAYFFLFPGLALAIATALARRRQRGPYTTLALAIAIDYLISLPFFVWFPVPERWAYPDSGAILLSDSWSSQLIEAFRPMSAPDNCFPSFHVSMTVAMVIVCYVYRVRLRMLAAVLGSMVVLSTFVLGIHWMADMVAGAAVGCVSVALALRATRNLCGPRSARRHHAMFSLEGLSS